MEGSVLKLTVPAKSVFGKEDGDNRALQAYARHLGAQNIDPSEVITRMKFDTKSEAPKLFFKAMRWLTDDEFPTIQQQGKTDAAVKAVTMAFSKTDSVAAPAPLKLEGKRPAPVVEEEEAPAPKPKTKAKAAPLPAEDDEEPVVRKEEKKPNAVPKAKADLSAMVDDWDEAE
jgi:outer membrane biosynthesis protein TonB